MSKHRRLARVKHKGHAVVRPVYPIKCVPCSLSARLPDPEPLHIPGSHADRVLGEQGDVTKKGKPQVQDVHDPAHAHGRDHGARPDALDAAEQEQREGNRRQGKRGLERCLAGAERLAAHHVDGALDPLAGNQDDVGRDLDRNAERQQHAAYGKRRDAGRPGVRREDGERRRAHVDHRAEDYVRRKLQHLDGMEIPSEQRDLADDEQRVDHEGECAEREPACRREHVGHARDGADAQPRVGDERNGERVGAHAEGEPGIALPEV